MRGTPEQWAKKAVALYRKWEADKIVAEKNQGGLMVESVIKAADRYVPVKLVQASRGTAIRAQPFSALYEHGRLHHSPSAYRRDGNAWATPCRSRLGQKTTQ